MSPLYSFVGAQSQIHSAEQSVNIDPEIEVLFRGTVDPQQEWEPDWDGVRQFLATLTQIAGGNSADCFFVSAIPIDDAGKELAPCTLHVSNDKAALSNLGAAVKALTETAIKDGHKPNIYYGISLLKPAPTRTVWQRGKEEDCTVTLCLVVDYDGWKGAKVGDNREWLIDIAGTEVETSPGSYQFVLWLDRPYPAQEVKPVAYALAKAMGAGKIDGADHTKSVEHLFRLPGGLNYPSAKKIAKGRSPQPVRSRLLRHDPWMAVTLDSLKTAILRHCPDAFDASQRSSSSGGPDTASEGEFDWNQRTKPEKKPISWDTAHNYLGGHKYKSNSEATWALVRKCRASGYSPEETYEFMNEHEATAAMQHYHGHADGFEKSLRADVIRAFSKKQEPPRQPAGEVFREFIGDGASSRTATPIRDIVLTADSLTHAPEMAEKGLIEQGAGIYQRGPAIVRPGVMHKVLDDGTEIEGDALFEVRLAEMREHMSKAARFLKFNERNNEWRRTNCPAEVAQSYLDRAGRWNLRHLIGTTTAPTLRRDGTILERPGYDKASGILFNPRGALFPAIPTEPTKDDAVAALAVLKAPLREFPFEADADRSVVLSAILTGCVRRTLPTAPLHGFSAPIPGSGKSKLMEIPCIVMTGYRPPPLDECKDEEELKKTIGAMLLQGVPVIPIDNCTFPLRSAFLCSVLTSERYSIRILGQSRAMMTPTNALFLATGNNLVIGGDMPRRSLMCNIDPQHEHPEEKRFAFDPVQDAMRDRPQLVSAALTILRAYIVAGRPPQADPLGSFEDWSRLVRDALIWLGEADPALSTKSIADADPERAQRTIAFEALYSMFGDQPFTVKMAIEAADPTKGEIGVNLLDALGDIARPHSGFGLDADRLGKFIRVNAKVVASGFRLMHHGMTHGRPTWRIIRIKGTAQ